MSKDSDKPISFDGYEQLAEAFNLQADTKPHNAYLERPTTISLLPVVSSMNALDAGCGPGWYSRWMVDRGARVTAIDASPNMLKFARQRLAGTDARIMQADLDKPFQFDDDEFDLVLMALTAGYLKNLKLSISEVARVTKPDGYFIFSICNPAYEFFTHRRTNSYFDEKMINATWYGFGFPVEIPFFMRPLTAYTEALYREGFVIERLIESKPTEEFKQMDEDNYNRMMKFPGFIHMRCKLTSTGK